MKHTISLLLVLCLGTTPLTAQEDDAHSHDESPAKAIASSVDEVLNRILHRNFLRADSVDVSDTTITEETENFFSDSFSLEVTGDTLLSKETVVEGNLLVKNGTLTVAGKIQGNTTVYNGDLIVLSSGIIEGNAQVINGSIRKEEGAQILGFEETTISRKAYSQRTTRKRLFHTSTRFEVPWEYEITDFDQFIFRYNRVESIFLGLGSDKKYYWDGSRKWNAYGFIGWGFKSHKWRTLLGLNRQFQYRIDDLHDGIIDIGVEGYSLTDTKDAWRISPLENTLSALLIHEDFRDYFQRNGFTIYTGHYVNSASLKTELKFGYHSDRYETMPNRVDWAFFGGKKTFRLNPPIDDGKIRSFFIFGGLSTVEKTNNGPEGWNLLGSAEFSRRSLGSDFGFDHYIIDVRRFQPLDSYESINIRFRAGTGAGNIPAQKNFELGGLGTLNAFPYKAFAGNRMLLLNTEFILNGSVLDDLDFFPSWLFRRVIFIAFSDAGWTAQVPTRFAAYEGFGSFSLRDIKHNLGIALGNRSGSFRIGMTWRTDVKAPVRFCLRIERPF